MGHRARPSAATPLIAPQFAVRTCSCHRLLHSLQFGIAVPPTAPQFAVEVAAQRFVDEMRPPIRVAPGRFFNFIRVTPAVCSGCAALRSGPRE